MNNKIMGVKLYLYERFHYSQLLREGWKRTKYLNIDDKTGLFIQDDTPNKTSVIVFERSINEDQMYVCIR